MGRLDFELDHARGGTTARLLSEFGEGCSNATGLACTRWEAVGEWLWQPVVGDVAVTVAVSRGSSDLEPRSAMNEFARDLLLTALSTNLHEFSDPPHGMRRNHHACCGGSRSAGHSAVGSSCPCRTFAMAAPDGRAGLGRRKGNIACGRIRRRCPAQRVARARAGRRCQCAPAAVRRGRRRHLAGHLVLRVTCGKKHSGVTQQHLSDRVPCAESPHGARPSRARR